MKTSRYNILLVLWALMLLVACSDSSSDESEKPVAPSITLDTEIPPVIVAEGGTVAVGFKASADWTATSDQPWCIVSPASGKAGNATVTVSAEKNEDYNERNADSDFKGWNGAEEDYCDAKTERCLDGDS